MARTVRDVALLYDILQGPDPLDRLTHGRPAADPMPTLERGVRGLRLARLPAEERSGVAAEVLDAYDRSLAVLAGLGAEIVDITLPFRLGGQRPSFNALPNDLKCKMCTIGIPICCA